MEQIIAEEEKVQKVQTDHSEMVDILLSRFIIEREMVESLARWLVQSSPLCADTRLDVWPRLEDSEGVDRLRPKRREAGLSTSLSRSLL